MKEILRDLEPAAEDLTYQNEPEEAVEQELSRRENYKKKGFEPETLPPPFPPPPMEPDRREEEYASDSNSEAGESEVHDSEGPAGAAMAPGENPWDGPSEDMVGENSEVEGSLHGSVTGVGGDAINDQQLTPPPPPSPPPMARRVRITERTPSRFFSSHRATPDFLQQESGASPCKGLSEGWDTIGRL